MKSKDDMAKSIAAAKAQKKVLPYGSGARNKSQPAAGQMTGTNPMRSRKVAGR
jgi:hypothetical protein